MELFIYLFVYSCDDRIATHHIASSGPFGIRSPTTHDPDVFLRVHMHVDVHGCVSMSVCVYHREQCCVLAREGGLSAKELISQTGLMLARRQSASPSQVGVPWVVFISANHGKTF
jgi:hypothetical protein